MLKCPGRYAPSFDLYAGGSSFWRERSAAYRMRREGTGCFWMLPVDLECVVPGTRRIDLPICMGQLSPKLPPLLVDLECVHQRASFDSDTFVVARLRSHWHGQVQTDGYRLAPFAHYTMERATGAGSLVLSPHVTVASSAQAGIRRRSGKCTGCSADIRICTVSSKG